MLAFKSEKDVIRAAAESSLISAFGVQVLAVDATGAAR